MPRKFHKKSKGGCDQCKERRVKCDEVKPLCTICAHRELSCSYTKAGVPRQTHFHPLSESVGPKQREREWNTPVSTQYELRHIQLMHKFATDTYKSLCGDQTDMEHWQLHIPRLAYTHEFLLHGIFALAALHLTATTPDPKQALSYLDTALQCNETALAPFREALSALGPANCDAVFAQSAIITVIGISLPGLNSKYRGESSSMIETMITVVELVQGANQVSHLTKSWKQDSIFCKYDFWRMDKAKLEQDVAHAIDKLRNMNRSNYITDEFQYTTNLEAIELLQDCFARFAHAPHPAPILAWPAYGRRGFVNGLSSRQPFSLLVLMHWGVLLHELSGLFWWAEECGQRLVAELLQELKGDNEEWNLALNWPQRKVGL